MKPTAPSPCAGAINLHRLLSVAAGGLFALLRLLATTPFPFPSFASASASAISPYAYAYLRFLHPREGRRSAHILSGNAPRALDELIPKWRQEDASITRTASDIERLVWSGHKPYIPRPLLSMHVRMGEKACEMVAVGFKKYMELAANLRSRFPSLENIWLSTEMQEVIDRTKFYPNWNFYFTNVTRQDGNMTMAMYGTNYPLVNFIMATEADFFIGALGSTWCYLIDGMRNTGGKVMSGIYR